MTCTFALAALTACTPKAEGVTIEAKDAFPAEIDMVVGFDFAKLKASPMMASFAPMAMADPDLALMANSLEECKVSLDKLRMTFASTVASEGEEMIFVIESPGAGTPETVKCLEKAMAAIAGESAGAVLFTARGKVLAAPAEGGDLMILPNENQIVYVTSKWQKETLDRINGDQERTPSPVTAAWDRVGQGAAIQLAVAVTDEVRAGMEGMPGAATITDITATVDAAESADLKLSGNFGAEADAAAVKAELDGLIGEARGAGVEAGLSQAVMDSLVASTEGSTATVSITVDAASAGTLAMLFGSL